MKYPISMIALSLALSSCQASYRASPQLFLKGPFEQKMSFYTTDGERVELRDLIGANRATAFIFWQRECPCVMRYQRRIDHLWERYADRGIGFFHVFSNTNEPFATAAREYARRSIKLPLLFDEGGRFASRLTITGTPSAAVISDRGEVIFVGWIDNEREEGERHRKAYLELALVNALNREPVMVNTSPMFGCRIR